MRAWLLACVATVAVGCGSDRTPTVISTSGTVEFQNVEGDAWLIRADMGTLYNPRNLADAFKVVGSRVQVSLVERRDLVGVQPGIIADIVSIATADDMLIPACQWPTAADTYVEASSTGCLPRSMFQVCEVPSGSVVHGDGSITTPNGETVVCENACSPTEYSLECRGPSSVNELVPVPPPDPSLHCRVIPIPTPPNALFYCCPCVP